MDIKTLEALGISPEELGNRIVDQCVDENGTGWDDWDEHYKDAMYRPGPLRERLDKAILEARDAR